LVDLEVLRRMKPFDEAADCRNVEARAAVWARREEAVLLVKEKV